MYRFKKLIRKEELMVSSYLNTSNYLERQSFVSYEKSTVKLAVVMDQLAGGIGGAESILFALYELFPDLAAFTTVLDKKIIPENYKNKKFNTSIIQHLPFAKKLYKAYLPIMPIAVEYLNLQEYDVVFSSHHCVAKGIIPRPDAIHICYCHSPARYIWDLFWTYSDHNKLNTVNRIFISVIANYLRMWDVTCASRVDYFLANSSYTAARIKKFYNRESEILYPPVDTNKFNYESSQDYYLMAGRLVAYKGYELAIRAFNESGKKLIIIGDGAEYKRLKQIAGKNIEMQGRVPDYTLTKYMNNCRGFIFPGKEDFGIVMAEAQAAGKPVIAYKAGGALDIILDNKTGVLFEEQSTQSLNQAILLSENIPWDHNYISHHSKKFDKHIFLNRLKYLIMNANELGNSKPVFYWRDK